MKVEKAFDRVPRRIGIPEVLVRSVMSLCEGAKTRVIVDSELSEQLKIKVEMHQGSVLSPFLLAVVVDVVTEFAREGTRSELLYADDLVLMSEIIKGLTNKFLKWKDAFESKGLNVNLGKTKVMVCDGITKNSISKGKVDLCGVSSLRVKALSFVSTVW